MNNKFKHFILYSVFGLFGFVTQSKAALQLVTTDYVGVPDSNSLTITGAGLTLNIWASTSTNPLNGLGLISKINTVVSQGYAIETEGTGTNSVRFILGIGSSQVLLGTKSFWNGVGNWHMITGTFDGTNIRLYEDGVEDPSSPKVISSTVIATNTGFNLNMGRLNVSSYFSGTLDDALVLNYPLTANQIKSLYQTRSYENITPCQGHWLLNEGSPNASMKGATFIDVCGNGNTGTGGTQTGGTLQMTPTALRYP